MKEMTQREYWNEVTDLARGITEEALESLDADTQAEVRENGFDDVDEAREALHERLHETIDGHQWVMYTSYNFDVLRFSDNDDYAIINFGVESVTDETGIKWASLAYGALYADVLEHSDFGMVHKTVES